MLTLKQCPRLALVTARVDLTRGTLTLAPLPQPGAPLPLELAIPQLRRYGLPDEVAEGSASGAVGGDAAAGSGGRPGTGGGGKGGGGGGPGGGVVQLDAGLTVERVRVCGDTVCSDVVGRAGRRRHVIVHALLIVYYFFIITLYMYAYMHACT